MSQSWRLQVTRFRRSLIVSLSACSHYRVLIVWLAAKESLKLVKEHTEYIDKLNEEHRAEMQRLEREWQAR